jgi:hypothetical protein
MIAVEVGTNRTFFMSISVLIWMLYKAPETSDPGGCLVMILKKCHPSSSREMRFYIWIHSYWNFYAIMYCNILLMWLFLHVFKMFYIGHIKKNLFICLCFLYLLLMNNLKLFSNACIFCLLLFACVACFRKPCLLFLFLHLLLVNNLKWFSNACILLFLFTYIYIKHGSGNIVKIASFFLISSSWYIFCNVFQLLSQFCFYN